MSDEEARELGPEMKADGWHVIGGESLMWMHEPSGRCIVVHDCIRRQAHVPCWGPEPASPDTPGWFVACRVHGEDGDPLFGDAFWVESYATAIRVARRIRTEILREPPSAKRLNRQQYELRKGEAWAEIRSMVASNKARS
jgi:hypothetical protein